MIALRGPQRVMGDASVPRLLWNQLWPSAPLLDLELYVPGAIMIKSPALEATIAAERLAVFVTLTTRL